MTLTQPRLIAQHRALLVRRAKDEIRRRNLEGVHFAAGGSIGRNKAVLGGELLPKFWLYNNGEMEFVSLEAFLLEYYYLLSQIFFPNSIVILNNITLRIG